MVVEGLVAAAEAAVAEEAGSRLNSSCDGRVTSVQCLRDTALALACAARAASRFQGPCRDL